MHFGRVVQIEDGIDLAIDGQADAVAFRLREQRFQESELEKMVAHREEEWLAHVWLGAEHGDAVLLLPLRIENRIEFHAGGQERTQLGGEAFRGGAEDSVDGAHARLFQRREDVSDQRPTADRDERFRQRV